jgi:four helix bundle protein
MATSRGPISSYRDLLVWQESMNLAEDSYRLTAGFPNDERFGLTSQIRRAAASVPANIAEGYGRDSRGAYVQQLRVAQGSLKELETHLLLAARIGLTNTASIEPLLSKAESAGKMLRSLIRTLEKS